MFKSVYSKRDLDGLFNNAVGMAVLLIAVFAWHALPAWAAFGLSASGGLLIIRETWRYGEERGHKVVKQ